MADLHWKEFNYFSNLLSQPKQACAALEYLVDDLHCGKEVTVNSFLFNAGSEDFLWALVSFLGNHDSRVAGNAAYILGTLAESEVGRFRVISLTESRHKEREQILPDLVSLLTSSDSESVMNAAGTIGTLAESDEGRNWLLSESSCQKMIERVTELLSDGNAWTASNAALVLARLSISEQGCEVILNNVYSRMILSQLIASLGTDEAGRGMNSAFAIGRLCDMAKGRSVLLNMSESNKMLSSLVTMLCSEDSGSSKNACFAISCLAASLEGHERLLKNIMCDSMLNTLSQLLVSDDHETGWFSAMTLRTFVSRAAGCVKVRELPKVITGLHAALIDCPENEDMVKEVKDTVEIIKPLCKPAEPTVEILSARSVHVSWCKCETRSGLPVTYKVYEGSTLVYSGAQLETTLVNLSPSTEIDVKLRTSIHGDDSSFSDIVSVTLPPAEPELDVYKTIQEDVPECPSQLSLLASTATQLKIGWSPPTNYNGAIKAYYIYLDGVQADHTTELSCILSGLKESTQYTVGVCASTSKGKGDKSEISCASSSIGDHTPSKPVLTIMGRNEINVTWNAPQVPLGRITRYDVTMNSKVIYSGTELYCTARQLTPNTEYTFIVTVFTNEGKLDSKPAKKKTPKDEYDPQRNPLYMTPARKDSVTDIPNTQSATDSSKRRKKKVVSERSQSVKLMNRSFSFTSTTVSAPAPSVTHQSQASVVKKSSSVVKTGSASSSPIQKDSPLTVEPEIQDTHNLVKKTVPKRYNQPITSNVTNHRPINTDVSSNKPVKSMKTKSASPSVSRRNNIDTHHVHKRTREKTTLTHTLPTNKQTPAGSVVKHNNDSNKHDMPERPVRSLTKLNIATFEPMLPPAKGQQRSKTFVSLRSIPSSSQNKSQMIRPTSPRSPLKPDLPDRILQAPNGRFIPMQFRTQPVNLPNMNKFTDNEAHSLRATSAFQSST